MTSAYYQRLDLTKSERSILTAIDAETGRSPTLRAVNLKFAATPSIRTDDDCWQWECSVQIDRKSTVPTYIGGRASEPVEAVQACYREVLGADRSDWKYPNGETPPRIMRRGDYERN